MCLLSWARALSLSRSLSHSQLCLLFVVQRHFKCKICYKQCGTATSLGGHTWHVHKETLLECDAHFGPLVCLLGG